ncbi:outer membrane beta-barrel protein [Pedobacter gandavensis]|uniref:Outer membrane beta-barrel protein n=1 Tax=Pedobacter gandavensis TaxID=2679963 RepID=A0ABR6EZS4_9SPHI|nr:outer membrane beta-barrel protein [Pedobacter gandavensis]MBB2150783.1 outer membrane beta-barrel protein [Pedobacter gandavensis]
MNHFYTVTALRLQQIQRIRYSSAALKKTLLLFSFLLSSVYGFAQNQGKQNPPPPLPTREISGMVRDSTDLGVIGATVTLTSAKDTLKTSTNSDGIFVFKNVKSATYTLMVQSLGYNPTKPVRYKQNDAIPRIVMDPITLKEEKNLLNEVVISGTPSITYKTDTVEYKASDYIVRKNATVDELLKKMEGMEVGTDGSLVHQGQAVTKAKLNGKEYLGGDIANAIKNLPAEIVDKIQVVDDYGDQAARTGVKDGDPEKILNITTRTDKSVGNMVNANVAAGSNKRFESGVFGTRINGNQILGVNGSFNNTINGVASSGDNGASTNTGGGGGRGGNTMNTGSAGSTGGSGGTTQVGNGSFSYRDKVSKKVSVNLNYGFTSTDVNSLTRSTAQRFAVIDTNVQKGVIDNRTDEVARSMADNLNQGHNVRLEVEAELDSSNFLRIIPTLRYSSSTSNRLDSIFQTGYNHRNEFTRNYSKTTKPQIGTSIFYQHVFKKPRRNVSMQVDLNSNNQDAEQIQDGRYVFFNPDPTKDPTDSLVNRIIARKNLQDNYRGSLTYVEPLTNNTQLEFNAQVNYNGYDNTATTRNIGPDGYLAVIDSLSNIYDYSFTQGRIAMNYRYGLDRMSKVRFSVGLTGVPAVLSGTKASLGTSTHRNSFNLIPIARFEYMWSRQHRIQINYAGNAVEPTFDQIQPVRDVTNPQNPVIGNPDLLASFTHSLNANYNNYIANSKLNYSLNVRATMTDNAVIRNVVQVRTVLPSGAFNTINETRYLNTNGVYNVSGNYSINKQLNDRKYNLAFSGSFSYDHRISMTNNLKNSANVLTMMERFGPRINPTEWFEINPNVSYTNTRSTNSLVTAANNDYNTLALNVDGRVYFLESYLFGYNASKNYVRGLASNITANPFVVNMYVEKEFFERRGKVTLQAFDILNQNHFVSRDIVGTDIINTNTNALSRYFMVRLTMRLQKWSGAQGKNGRGVMRRGDGSFM